MFQSSQNRVGSRGRGRGRGSARAHSNRNATFISSRVEEPVDHESDASDESQEIGVKENGSAADDLSSESGQDTVANTSFKPYSVLLQSLNADTQQGQPERKKRKIEITGAIEKQEDLIQDLDLVDEPEEAEVAELGDAEDSDEPDETENSKFHDITSMFCLNLAGDPFMRHFANVDETDLAQQISDVSNDKLFVNINKGSLWSSTLKCPASSKNAPLSSPWIPQSTRDLDVRCSPHDSNPCTD